MTKHKKNFGKIFTVFSLFICFLLSLTFAELFSNLITKTHYSSAVTANKNYSYTVYAVCLYQSPSKPLAAEYAATLQKSNGAGYIWKMDNTFYVLASAYLEQNDAELVKKNLEENKHSVSIIELQIPEVEIPSSNTNKENNVINNAVGQFKTIYQDLYDVSISLDTEIFDQSKAKAEISNIMGETKKIFANFDSVFGAKLNQKLLEIKLALTNAENILQNLINCDSTKLSFMIKYSYIDVLRENYDISTSLL